MEVKTVYEDKQIIVVEKPSGMVCNRARTVKQKTLQDWMEEKFRMGRLLGRDEEEKYFRERNGLVHRLDKETEGLMVLAKTPKAFSELLRQFREREVKKEYLALTHGIWKVREGKIRLPVGRRRSNRKLMGVREDGRESETDYRVEEEYSGTKFPAELKVEIRGYDGFSLVRFYPRTGRMHQIRVHARQLGHALVGDELYAGRKRSREDRKWCGRLMLQAVRLELTHPVTRKRMSWENQSEQMNRVLQYLT